MSSMPSAQCRATEAAVMSLAHAPQGRPHGGSPRDAASAADASGRTSSGTDQVCRDCGFARGIHARHCPVFEDALLAGVRAQSASGIAEQARADACRRARPAKGAPPGDNGPERARKDSVRANPTEPKPKVLIADDHPVHRQLTRAIFEALACSVDVVEDGAAALALCAVEAFDLVLIDRHMPVLEGDEAVRRLRAGGGPSSRAYVASCSSDPPADLAAGYDACAPKPLDVDAACTVLTEALAAAASPAKQN